MHGRGYVGSRDVDLGFRPPAEPLLKHVFEGNAATLLSEMQPFDFPDAVRVANPELLAAMKIRSIPDRTSGQKRVKDVADLHALLWHVQEYESMRSRVSRLVSDAALQRMLERVDDETYEDAAGLLQVDRALLKDSIEQLVR